MKVALKYCGGCDPCYDRVAYWEAIQAEAGERVAWQRPGEGGYQAILLVCGCEKACPLEDLPQGKKILTVKHDHLAPAEVVARLLGRES